jgi:hypothetical protein
MTAVQLKCPVCGRADGSQRVSALVGNGTRTSVTQQSFFSAWANNRNNHGLIVPNRYTTNSTSGVAMRLRAPGKPWPALDKNFWMSVGISAGLGLLLNIGTSPLGGAISGALLGGAASYIFTVIQNWQALKRAWRMHEGRLVQYYGSYYCRRDDVVFMPGVYSAQPEQYKVWLFQYN